MPEGEWAAADLPAGLKGRRQDQRFGRSWLVTERGVTIQAKVRDVQGQEGEAACWPECDGRRRGVERGQRGVADQPGRTRAHPKRKETL